MAVDLSYSKKLPSCHQVITLKGFRLVPLIGLVGIIGYILGNEGMVEKNMETTIMGYTIGTTGVALGFGIRLKDRQRTTLAHIRAILGPYWENPLGVRP